MARVLLTGIGNRLAVEGAGNRLTLQGEAVTVTQNRTLQHTDYLNQAR